MNKTMTALGLALAGITLSACASTASTSSDSSDSGFSNDSDTNVGASLDTAQEQLYLAALSTSDSEDIQDADDSELLAYGHEVCDDYDSGQVTIDIVLSLMDETNFGPDGVGFIMGDAVESFCSEYSNQQTEAFAQYQ